MTKKNEEAKNVVLDDKVKISSSTKVNNVFLFVLILVLVGVSIFFSTSDASKRKDLAITASLKNAQGSTPNPAISQVCPKPVLNLKIYLDRSFNAYNDRDAIKSAAKKVVDMFSARYAALKDGGSVNVQILAYASYGQWQTPTTDTQIDIADATNREHQKNVIDNIFYTNNINDAYIKNSRYTYVANQLGMDFNNPDLNAGSKPWFDWFYNDPGLNNISGAMVGLGQYNNTLAGSEFVAQMGVFITRGAFSGNTGPSYLADELGPLVPGGPQPSDDQLVDNVLANIKGVEYGGDVTNALRSGGAFFGGNGPRFGTRPPTNVVGILAGSTINDTNIQNNMNYVFGNRDVTNSANSGWFDANQIDSYFNDRIFDQLEASNCATKKTKYKPAIEITSVGVPKTATGATELFEADSPNGASFPVTIKNTGDIILKDVSVGGMTSCSMSMGSAFGTLKVNEVMTCTGIIDAPDLGTSGMITKNLSAKGFAYLSDSKTEEFDTAGGATVITSLKASVSDTASTSINVKPIKLPV